jgi:hypothetical protein
MFAAITQQDTTRLSEFFNQVKSLHFRLLILFETRIWLKSKFKFQKTLKHVMVVDNFKLE